MIRFRSTGPSNASLVVLVGFLALLWPMVCAARQQELTDEQQAARTKLNEGVDAYKSAQFDQAIEDFKQAAQLDPSLTNARLYLATAYATQYIPGAPSADNLNFANQAIEQFEIVLGRDPKNLAALDGTASLLYQMGGNPYDPQKLKQSKTCWLKHIDIKPDDPQPYYWIGVIDWNIAFHADRQIRQDWTKQTAIELRDDEPLPSTLRDQLKAQTEGAVEEGMKYLKKALEVRPDYDDAMAYLNLIYRQKADIEEDPNARDEDTKAADELVHKVMEVKQARMRDKQPPQ